MRRSKLEFAMQSHTKNLTAAVALSSTSQPHGIVECRLIDLIGITEFAENLLMGVGTG